MSSGLVKSTQAIYTGSLLSQKLHPVPRNHWVSTMQSKSKLQTHPQRSDLEHLKTRTSFGTQTLQKSEQPLILHLHNSVQKYNRFRKHYTQRRPNQKITTILFHCFEKTQKLECKS